MANKWATPDSWDNYTDVPEKPGVYVLKVINMQTGKKYLAYIGSSSNLLERYKNHPVKSKLYKKYPHGYLVAFYFKVFPFGFLEYETVLIKRLRPKYNVKHNGLQII